MRCNRGSGSGDRQQKLLVVVLATLAADEGQGHRIRRTTNPVVPTAEESCDFRAFAIRQGARAAGWCRIGMGIACDLRIHRRALAAYRMLAAGSGRTRT